MQLVDLIVLLFITGVVVGIGRGIGGFARGGYLTSIAADFAGATIGGGWGRLSACPSCFWCASAEPESRSHGQSLGGPCLPR